MNRIMMMMEVRVRILRTLARAVKGCDAEKTQLRGTDDKIPYCDRNIKSETYIVQLAS